MHKFYIATLGLAVALFSYPSWAQQIQFPTVANPTGRELWSLHYVDPPSSLPLYMTLNQVKTFIGAGGNVGAVSLLGNPTGVPAPQSEITLGTNLSFSGSVLNAAGGVSLANPSTATVGTSAVNGSASTAMRSDAAPPINLTMTPTWTGLHTWGATGSQIAVGAGTAGHPSIVYSGLTNSGLDFESTENIQYYNNGNNRIGLKDTGLVVQGSKVVGFASGLPNAGESDTAISRDSAGVIDVGTGAQGSKAGSMNMTNLAATGTVTFAGVTTGTNADFACFAAGGVMTLQTSSCTISSLRFKNVSGEYNGNAINTILNLKPITFTMKAGDRPNADWNYNQPQIGLAAEDVATIEPRCAIYEQDGITPKSYRQECLIAVLVAAIQEMRKQ